MTEIAESSVVSVSVSCPCHQAGAECSGALQFLFASSMFPAESEAEYLAQRTRAANTFLEIWDAYYEQVRRKLSESGADLPERGGRKYAVVAIGEAEEVRA